MRIVAVTRILDEADVVESFARHTAHYTDHHVFLDNGSFDGTPDILRSLRNAGFNLTVVQNGSRWFNEPDYNTFLYRLAVGETGADWVIFLDADEFIDDRRADGGLRSVLARMPSDVVCVRVMLSNYRPSNRDDPAEPVVPLRVRWLEAHTDVPKAIVRGNLLDRNFVIEGGNHGVLIDSRPAPHHDEPSVRLGHYPERSSFQALTKVVRGWLRVLAAGESEIAKGTSYHYRSRFELLRDKPEVLLRSAWLREFNRSTEGMMLDPLPYHGGRLEFTPPLDEPLRAVRSLVGYLELFAHEHGRLLDECPEARRMAVEWASSFARIIG